VNVYSYLWCNTKGIKGTTSRESANFLVGQWQGCLSLIICEVVWWGHAYKRSLLLYESCYSGLQYFQFIVILESSENILNSWSHHWNCSGSFIVHRPCLCLNAPTAATVLRPELDDMLCTSSIVFLDRSTSQITFDKHIYCLKIWYENFMP